MPEITVVIPAYNPGPLLTRAVSSVLDQDFDDLECIVVDDGSREDLSGIVELDHSRVRYHRQENRGVSAARNVGVTLTDSRYVAFLDQDDEWLPGKVEAQREALRITPTASFCHTRFYWTSPKSMVPSPSQEVSFETSLAGRIHVCLSSIMVERTKHDTVGGHHLAMAQHQDWDLILKLLLAFGPPTAPGDIYVRYHVHEQNASKDYEVNAREAEALRALYEAWARSNGKHDALTALKRGRRVAGRTYAFQAVDHARTRVRARDWSGGVHHMRKALRYDPRVVLDSAVRYAVGRFGPK